MNNVVALQLTQSLRQHFLCGSRDFLLKLSEPVSSILEVKQDQRFPFPTDDVSGNFYWTVAPVKHGVSPDPRFQEGAY
jgi:hypothetical protein